MLKLIGVREQYSLILETIALCPLFPPSPLIIYLDLPRLQVSRHPQFNDILELADDVIALDFQLQQRAIVGGNEISKLLMLAHKELQHFVVPSRFDFINSAIGGYGDGFMIIDWLVGAIVNQQRGAGIRQQVCVFSGRTVGCEHDPVQVRCGGEGHQTGVGLQVMLCRQYALGLCVQQMPYRLLLLRWCSHRSIRRCYVLCME